MLLMRSPLLHSGAAFFALETHYGPQMLSELLEATSPVAGLASLTLRPRLEAACSAPILTLTGGKWRAELSKLPRPRWVRAGPFDTGIVTMTSGTSGKPKAIAVPFSSLSMSAVARNMRYPYRSKAAGRESEREAVNVMFVWEALRPLCFGQAC